MSLTSYLCSTPQYRVSNTIPHFATKSSRNPGKTAFFRRNRTLFRFILPSGTVINCGARPVLSISPGKNGAAGFDFAATGGYIIRKHRKGTVDMRFLHCMLVWSCTAAALCGCGDPASRSPAPDEKAAGLPAGDRPDRRRAAGRAVRGRIRLRASAGRAQHPARQDRDGNRRRRAGQNGGRHPVLPLRAPRLDRHEDPAGARL